MKPFKIKRHREPLLTFSIAHITLNDNDRLKAAAASTHPGMPSGYIERSRIPGLLVREIDRGAGWLVRVTDSSVKRLEDILLANLSQEATNILIQAIGNSDNLVWFDPDWPIDKDLKTFEW